MKPSTMGKNLILYIGGNWGEWLQWYQCIVSCGGGQQQRARFCSFRGTDCTGEAVASQKYNLHKCPVPVNWGSWTSWESCIRTCGNGYRKKRRYCDNPSPSNGGSYCLGYSFNVKICNNRNCPVDGNRGQWTTWGSCNATCGSAIQRRYRRCDSPAPYFGGYACIGLSSRIRQCNDTVCKSQEETQCYAGIIGGVATGGVAGTLVLFLIVYFIYRTVKHLKNGEQENLSTRSGINERITRGRQNNYRETVEFPINSTKSGINDRVTLGPQNDYRETVQLTCNSTSSGQHDKVTHDIYENQLFMAEDTEATYENRLFMAEDTEATYENFKI